jgi:class 3 adenylate cyclase
MVMAEVEAHQGSLVRLQGGSALAMFDAAEPALHAAAAIHRSQAQENRQSSVPIGLTIGIDQGHGFDATFKGHRDVYGDVVSGAARARSLGAPGRIMMPQSALPKGQVARVLSEESLRIRVARIELKSFGTIPLYEMTA